MTFFTLVAVYGSVLVPFVFFYVMDIVVHDREKEEDGKSPAGGVIYLTVWLFCLVEMISYL